MAVKRTLQVRNNSTREKTENLSNWLLFFIAFGCSLESIFGFITRGLMQVPSILNLIFPPIFVLSILLYSRRYYKMKLWIWLTALYVPLLLNKIFNYEIPLYEGSYALVLLRVGLNSALIFIFFYANIKTMKSVFFVIRGFILGASLTGILLLIGYFLGMGQYTTFTYERIDVERFKLYTDPNIITLYFIAGIAQLAFIFVGQRELSKSYYRIFVALIIFINIFISLSRGGAIAIIFTFFCVLLLSYFIGKGIYMQLKVIILSVLFFMLLLLVNIYYGDVLSNLLIRFRAISVGYDESAITRFSSYEWFIKNVFTGFYLIGPGFATFNRETSFVLPHCSIIDIFLMGGYPYLITYLLLWLFSFRNCIALFNLDVRLYKVYSVFLISMLVGIFILLLSLSIPHHKLIWILLGTTVGLKNAIINQGNK